MSIEKSEVEIQAVNLAQQWYSVSAADLPELPTLLSQYTKCFHTEADKSAFLKETLRIAQELVAGPKQQLDKTESFEHFRQTIEQHPNY